MMHIVVTELFKLEPQQVVQATLVRVLETLPHAESVPNYFWLVTRFPWKNNIGFGEYDG